MDEARDSPGVIAPPPLIALTALLVGLALDWFFPSFIVRAVFGFATGVIIGAIAVAHARAAHCDRTDPGHDLALGQMPVAHQPLAAVICQLVGMAAHKSRNLGLDRLRQQRSRAIAQNLGQRIGKRSWLGE